MIEDGAENVNPNIAFVRRLIHTPLSDGKTLLDHTTFEGVSYWWNVDATFYESVLNQTSYRSAGGLKGVFPRLFRHLGAVPQLLYDISLRLLSGLIGGAFEAHDGALAVITQDVEWRRIRDAETGRFVDTDSFFHSIIMQLRCEHPLLSTYPLDVSIPGGFKVGVKKSGWWVPHVPLNGFWTPGAWLNEQHARKQFTAAWDSVKGDATLRRLCVYQGRDLYPEIRSRLESYFLYVLPQSVKYVEIGKTMLREGHVSLLLLQNEYSWRERSLVIAARMLGVPVLAVQHGIIIPSHKGYMYERGEVSQTLSIVSPFCPLPDYTAVFGEGYKELLVDESVYPSDRVVVTGPPRYDLLIKSGQLYSKARFIEQQKIPPDRKIVLWATQCHSLSDEENRANIDAVLEAATKLNDVALVIKQHPAESQRYTQMLVEASKGHGGDVHVVSKSSDTFELLYACDLLITKNSTTAVEAVALGKPVVVLNLGGAPDAIDYVKEGVAVGVYSPDELGDAILKLLRSDSTQKRHRQNYISKTIYRNDGGASKRVVELIKRIIREGTKGDPK